VKTAKGKHLNYNERMGGEDARLKGEGKSPLLSQLIVSHL
jgi:hypothetical protein